MAAVMYALYVGGYMRAFSAGFENTDIEYDQENDTIILRKNKLYEISCVNVPANALALAKSKGLDVTPIEDHNKKMAESLANQQRIVQKLLSYEKEGRVISKKNRTLIEDAVNYAQNMIKSLKELLSADDEEKKIEPTQTEVTSTDKSQEIVTPKVETPPLAVDRKKMRTKKQVNAVIRRLLAFQTTIK